MERMVIISWILAVCLCFCYTIEAHAADEVIELPAAGLEDVEFAYGTVTRVLSNGLIVREYDLDAAEDREITYEIDPDAEFDNVETLQEIAIGDMVDIEYAVRNGKRVVLYVSRETPHGERMPDSEEELY